MKTNEVWRAVAVALYRALKVAVGGTGDGWQTGQGADASAKINAALQAHRDALAAESKRDKPKDQSECGTLGQHGSR